MDRYLALMIPLVMILVAGCRSGERGSGEQEAHGESAEHDANHEPAEHEGHADHEGEAVRLTAAQRAAAEVEVGPAGPHAIAITQELPGEVVVNADQLAHVVPRFPGIAREVRKKLGDRVQAGEVLAIIESNESLSPYEVKSLIAGTVIGKHITLGEFVRDDSDVYVVADLSSVWVNVTVYARDLARVRAGQRVQIRAAGVPDPAAGRIAYVGPVVGEATRTAVARVVLPNPKGIWRPGLFVAATVELEEMTVPVAVPDEAVQTIAGRSVVFVAEGDAFIPRPVVAGRTDGDWVEIVSGLRAGESCVIRNSFILKSELGKGAAGHDH
jgi:cobalt-zinc-cadmium efflux system membrane fusion protein